MTEAMRKEYKKAEFGLHEVYEVNILISTGEGKAKQSDARTTVYKRSSERYNLKMKASKGTYKCMCRGAGAKVGWIKEGRGITSTM